MSVHLYMAKRDRRYPRLNHGWFLSFQISRWGLPAIQNWIYIIKTPMNVRKNPSSTPVFVGKYIQLFLPFFLCHIFYSPVNYITSPISNHTALLLSLLSLFPSLLILSKLPCIIFAGQSKELNKWITVADTKHNLKSQGWKHPKTWFGAAQRLLISSLAHWHGFRIPSSGWNVVSIWLRVADSNVRKHTSISSGWWYTYPSEKCEFVSWDDYSPYMENHKIHVPNHQPVIFHNRLFTLSSISWPSRLVPVTQPGINRTNLPGCPSPEITRV